MHACTSADAQSSSVLGEGRTMAEWSMMDREWPPDGSYNPCVNPFSYGMNNYYQEYQEKTPQLGEFFPPQAQQYLQQHPSPPQPPAPPYTDYAALLPRGENPREIRNKAEKQRRDKLNNSISELASMVPPVVASTKKIDKTGVLRLTAHYLRAHQYVFGDSIGPSEQEFTPETAPLLLAFLRGFLLTTTYKGIIVVVSQNIQQYLGHAELDLLGQNIFNYTHPEDHQTIRENLMPKPNLLGSNGELLLPEHPQGKQHIASALAGEKRHFLARFKKHTLRSEPVTYVQCFVEGTLRKSDKACRGSNRCCQVVRRARARGDNPCSSGNDVVFIGLVRPTTETFMTEQHMEAFRMEYRTRHSVDGEIMECEQRISLVAGYMTHEVNGINAMTFIHRDDVRWVIFALREMYDQHRLVGESCYRLMAKSGQFIYMKTRGILDVDEESRAVRSFVCTNTVVDEEEGKYLIKMMKKKCMMMVQKQRKLANEIEDLQRAAETLYTTCPDETLPVHDLEKVILNLVTDLPAQLPESNIKISESKSSSPDRDIALPLAIIPPKKERTISSIEKIYNLLKPASLQLTPNMFLNNYQRLQVDKDDSKPVPQSPVHIRMAEQSRQQLLLRRQLDGMIVPETAPSSSNQANAHGGAALKDNTILIEPAPTGGVSITVSNTLIPRTNKAEVGTSSMVQTSRKRNQPAASSVNKKPNNGKIDDCKYPIGFVDDSFDDFPSHFEENTTLDIIEPSIQWELFEDDENN